MTNYHDRAQETSPAGKTETSMKGRQTPLEGRTEGLPPPRWDGLRRSIPC